MPPLPTAERRDQLVAAAIQVATKEGVLALTTRRVAAEVGVAPGVVHYCFGSMENLLREMIKVIVDGILDRAVTALVPGDDLRAALERVIDVTRSEVESEPGLHLLTYELTTNALRQPSFGDLGRWQYECYFAAAEHFFHRVAEHAGITWNVPERILARMFVNLNEGVTLAWLVDRDTAATDAVCRAFVDQFVALASPAKSNTR